MGKGEEQLSLAERKNEIENVSKLTTYYRVPSKHVDVLAFHGVSGEILNKYESCN